MVSEPALPSTRALEVPLEKVPEPVTSEVSDRFLHPLGASCAIRSALRDVPTLLLGTVLLAVKLTVSVAAMASTSSAAAPRMMPGPRRGRAALGAAARGIAS